MIKLENLEIVGWEAAIRGMRNPMNSWDRSDSCTKGSVWCNEFCGEPIPTCDRESGLCIGPNDHSLMTKLANAGSVHGKFRRMITVYIDITAPLYWWKEFDTYKVGTVANSCSTMHKIHEKEFTLEDFSTEHLDGDFNTKTMLDVSSLQDGSELYSPLGMMTYCIIPMLNRYRHLYLTFKEKTYWWNLIQLLPSSYNQKRTVMMNYEVLANIYKYRKDHKLDEWREFCKWIETLPYSEIITGGKSG